MTFNDQDPPWFGEKIKAKIELKNRVYKECIKNGWLKALYHLLQNLTSEIFSYISKSKNELGDFSRSLKSYWAKLKTLWNGKKVPNIPPLLKNNELVIEFNKYFTSQCTAINNNRVLSWTLLYANPLLYSWRTVLHLDIFLMFGKKVILF